MKDFLLPLAFLRSIDPCVLFWAWEARERGGGEVCQCLKGNSVLRLNKGVPCPVCKLGVLLVDAVVSC